MHKKIFTLKNYVCEYLVMSTAQRTLPRAAAQCSVVTFSGEFCRVPRRVQIMKRLHLNFKQILFCIMLLLGLSI